MMATNRQAGNITAKEADFQRRYESAFHWKSAVSVFQAWPGLRAFYPMSAVGVAGEAQDLQSLGNHLTLNGNPQFGYEGLIPYCAYDGTGDYHNITDAASGNAFDILATAAAEPFIADNGLTLGCWCYPEETTTAERLMTKWGNVGNYAYQLGLSAGNQFFLRVSDDGTNSDLVLSAAITTFSTWYHVVGRFIPSTSVDLLVNGVETNQATARAAIFNSTADFEIASENGGTNPFQGRISMAPVCAAQLSNTIIKSSFEQTKAMYGVK